MAAQQWLLNEPGAAPEGLLREAGELLPGEDLVVEPGVETVSDKVGQLLLCRARRGQQHGADADARHAGQTTGV